MTKGAFRSFVHDHRFEMTGEVTTMTDEIEFRSPLGPVGRVVDRLYLAGYLRRLLEGRCRAIKHAAERCAGRESFAAVTLPGSINSRTARPDDPLLRIWTTTEAARQGTPPDRQSPTSGIYSFPSSPSWWK